MKLSKAPLFFWITLSVSLLIASGSIAYYFIWLLPSLEKEKLELQETKAVEQTELEKEKEIQRLSDIKSCQAQAYEDYSINWDRNCKNQGLQEDCELPIALSVPLDEARQKEEENCIKIYSQ